MTTTGTDAERDRFDRVVAALTQAARDGADVAELVAYAAAAAAANVGGIEQLLAGRPGSWEADYLRQLLESTIGDERNLHHHRNEPITVRVHIEDILTDLGIAGLYEQAYDELDRRENAVCARHPESIFDLDADEDAELAAVDALRERLNALRAADWAAYGQAFAEQVRHAASELFPVLRVPVEVQVATDWQPDSDSGSGDGPEWRLWETARGRTPLPGSGLPLTDYPPGIDIAEAMRAAGRDPLTRITDADGTEAKE